MDLDLKKVLLTQLIGRVYHNIYFSSYSPLQVQNLPRQSLPESSWVRVRNRLAGIGGSDLHLLYGNHDMRVAPAVAPGQKHFYPGHEVVGEVIEIGDDVQNLHVGDRVVLQNGPNCLTAGVEPLCHACAYGYYNLCEQGVFLAAQPLGGGWSEEMLLHEQQLYRVPGNLSDEQAVMLEPVAVALHAVLRHLPLPGERALIIGAGTIGLLTQQILATLVPQVEVSVLARYPFQIEQATRQGAAHIIYSHDTYVGIQRATQARLYHGFLGNQMLIGGYDVIYDTIGRRQTLHHALRWVRSQGTVVLVGKNPHLMNIDLTPFWHQEINLLGSTAHGVEYWPLQSEQRRSTMSVAAELIAQGLITPEQLITHHFALNNYQHALLTTTKKAESRAIKVVFDYSLLPASVVPNVRASAPRIRRPTTTDFNQRTREPALYNTGPQSGGTLTPILPETQRPPATRSVNRNVTRNIPPVEVNNAHDEDEDTATALPAIGRQHTRESLLYTAQQQQNSDSIPRPPERTRELAKKQSQPSVEEEGQSDGQPTVHVSKDEIKHLIPHTEDNLSVTPDMTNIQTPDMADIEMITPAPLPPSSSAEDHQNATNPSIDSQDSAYAMDENQDSQPEMMNPESGEQESVPESLSSETTVDEGTHSDTDVPSEIVEGEENSSQEQAEFVEEMSPASEIVDETPQDTSNELTYEPIDDVSEELPDLAQSETSSSDSGAGREGRVKVQSSQSRNRNRKKRSGGR